MTWLSIFIIIFFPIYILIVILKQWSACYGKILTEEYRHVYEICKRKLNFCFSNKTQKILYVLLYIENGLFTLHIFIFKIRHKTVRQLNWNWMKYMMKNVLAVEKCYQFFTHMCWNVFLQKFICRRSRCSILSFFCLSLLLFFCFCFSLSSFIK